jgi:predicted transposase
MHPELDKAMREFQAEIEEWRAHAAKLPKDSPERQQWIDLAKAFEQAFEQAMDLALKDPEAAEEARRTLRSMFENN